MDWIAEVTRSTRREHVQTLWSGYGEVVRVTLDDGRTVIVKHVRPPVQDSVGDRRKRASYDNERAFYRDLAPRCDDTCRVARCYASHATGDEWLFILEDLDAAGFIGRHEDAPDVTPCLAWLAAFHARFVGVAHGPGTYWHLATRTDELAAIADPALRALAPRIDALLVRDTLVHGDAKEANFCFGPRSVAAVDFQYAGAGCAMSDVAYLLYGRRDDEAAHLDTYFRLLARPDLEARWRPLYPIAKLDFCRFLAGWAPAQWARDVRGQQFVRDQSRLL